MSNGGHHSYTNPAFHNDDSLQGNGVDSGGGGGGGGTVHGKRSRAGSRAKAKAKAFIPDYHYGKIISLLVSLAVYVFVR